jgi:two-component system sensor histidine kinase YcbA
VVREQALHIAKDIHEIKKDYQRVMAGLEKLTPVQRASSSMPLSQIFYIIKENTQRQLMILGKHVNFRVEHQEDFIVRMPYYLVSILNNLITNSIEALNETGILHVEQMSEGAWLLFRVEDTGRGIMARDMGAIFDPGFSSKFDPQTGKLSTGLGLTHVNSLVSALGGEITVQSTVGEKTVFVVRLPRDKIIY